MNRADVVLARCSQGGKSYGMRFEETQPRHWSVTWAFALGVEAAAREGYKGSTLEGELELADCFPGCPHCAARSFVLCGSCDRVGCSAIDATWFDCPWCPNDGPIAGSISRLKTVGD